MGYPYPYFCLCAFLGPYKTTKSSGLGSTMSVVWVLEMTGFMTYWVLRNVHQVVNFILCACCSAVAYRSLAVGLLSGNLLQVSNCGIG